MTKQDPLKKEIEQRIWEGSIPIKLSLAPADIVELTATTTLPEPFQSYFILGPRTGYFPFLINKIRTEWIVPLLTLGIRNRPGLGNQENDGTDKGNMGINDEDIWFEYNGIPIKWHYPIGLLYDIMVAIDDKKKRILGEKESALELAINNYYDTKQMKAKDSTTWDLVLHLKKYPLEKLIRNPTVKNCKELFMSLLKEADFVRFGSTNRATELSKSDQLMLLDGMENRDIATFQTMNRLHGSAGIDWNSSKPYIGGLRGDRGLENLPKAIPVRCYVAGPDLSAPDAYEIFQAPILINNFSTSSSPIPDGNAPPFSWTTLGEAVYSILKDRNVLDTEDDLASSEIQTFASLGSESHPSFSNSPHHTKTSRPQWTQKWKCIIQGISPSWDTPLLWISDNLSYPDNFIHIVLIGIS